MKVAGTIDLLLGGDMQVVGLLPYSSNYTFLVKLASNEGEVYGVYKPTRGERPLWDFPSGTLAAREVAAYLVSEAAGWNIVPPTVLRPAAELGPGSVQLFIPHEPERHYFVLLSERRPELAIFAVFDAVINNADRKGGHVLEDDSGRLWAVDHGVTFHVDPKLRTVIWEFAGEPLPAELRAGLVRLSAGLEADEGLGRDLADLLSPAEAAATLRRTRSLLEDGRFPVPGEGRPVPWPLV